MRLNHASAALLLLTLVGCGGNGDKEDTASSLSSTPASDTNGAGMPATENITSVPNNPLNLSPAPIFAGSSRKVTYDDCFPQHEDIQVGDTLVDRIEKYESAPTEISAYHITNIVVAVAPHSSTGKQGVLATSETPVYGQDGALQSKIISDDLFFRGGRKMLITTQYDYGLAGTTRSHTFTDTPLELGDIAFGHNTLPYKPGDSTVTTYDSLLEGNVPHAPRKIRMTETYTFLGVEEGTAVAAYTFPYTCVFRQVLTSEFGSTTMDHYSHKLGTAKTVVYDSRLSRPLVNEVVSDTALQRRLK